MGRSSPGHRWVNREGTSAVWCLACLVAVVILGPGLGWVSDNPQMILGVLVIWLLELVLFRRPTKGASAPPVKPVFRYAWLLACCILAVVILRADASIAVRLLLTLAWLFAVLGGGLQSGTSSGQPQPGALP